MELKDTVDMMLSDDYKERIRAEYFQLKIRCEKLKAYLEKMTSRVLPNSKEEEIYHLQCAQLTTMKIYLQALENRAFAEKINLAEVAKER